MEVVKTAVILSWNWNWVTKGWNELAKVTQQISCSVKTKILGSQTYTWEPIAVVIELSGGASLAS